MPSNLDFLTKTRPVFTPSQNTSPTRSLVLLALAIFAAEIVAMLILYFVKIPNYAVSSLLDGLIMVAMIFPALYLLQLKPLQEQIEKQTQAELALHASEELFRSVTELLPVGVWIIDKNGQVVHGNPASRKIWAGARYVGIQQYGEYKGWWADTGKPVKPEEWAATRAVTRGETVIDEEINIESFDGAPKVILNSAVPLLDEKNTIRGAIVVNQDITQRRQIEKELIQTNELQGRYFNSIDSLIAYMDRDFNFVRVNEAYARSAGHPAEYFNGKNHFDLYPHAENQAIFSKVVETGEPFSVLEKPFEYPEFPERGVTYWDWSVEPVKGSTGAVEGVVLSLVDVTERKRAELQLEHKNKELLDLSDAEHKLRILAEGLVQASLIVNTSLEPDTVLREILEQIRKTIPFQGAKIMLLEGKSLHVASFLGYEDHPESIPSLGKPFSLENYPLLQQVCASRQPVNVDSSSGHPVWVDEPGLDWVHSFLSVPLHLGEEVIGITNLNSEFPGAFSQEAVDKLLAFSAPAALALHNAHLYKAESTARQAAETLSAAAQALTKSLDLEQVIHTLLDHIQAVVDSGTARVTFLEDETTLTVRATRRHGQPAGQDHLPTFPTDGMTNSAVHRIMSARKSFIFPNSLPVAQVEQLELEQIGNWLIVPIIASDNAIGLVEMGKATNDRFSTQQIQWVEALVGQAAVALQNAWLFQQVRAGSERLQSLARKLVEVQEKERYHIARELHDDAGQALSLLKLNLGRLEQDADCPQHVRLRLDELKGVTDGVLENLHRLAIDLRPTALDHLGLVVALEQYAKSLNSDKLTVRFKATGFEGDRLPQDVETSLYRIVQEALTNVLRHAQAKNVGVLLQRGEGKVKVFVEDDGVGFDNALPDNNQRLGLVGMQERAEMFGGTLTLESSPGKGTAVIVEVPDAHSNTHRR